MRQDLNAVEVDDKVFCTRRVQELLETLDYLKDSGTLHPFSSNVFQNFMLDMIFVNDLKLWQYVDSEMDNLDNLFALGAMAIATALKDFQEGYNMPLDVSCAQWRGDYIRFMRLISEMREDVVVREWLVNYQRAIIARGQASLRSRLVSCFVVIISNLII